VHITSESAGERREGIVRMPGSRNLHQGGIREGDADGLALTAVDPVISEGAAVCAVGRPAGEAVGAGPIAESERRDHKVALGDVGYIAANLFDNPDELMADRPESVRRIAAVVPKVRPAHTAENDTDHSVRRRLDARIGTLAHGDGTGAVEDCCTHVDN
jgi:hypothetical protein